MNSTALKSSGVNGRDRSSSRPSAPARPRRGEQVLVAPYPKREFHRASRRHDPMLAFNMSVFNSAKVRESTFDSLRQREEKHSGSWSSLMGQSRQHERRSRTAPATQPIFVRFANPVRSIPSPSKKAITQQPKRHSLNLARGWANGGGTYPVEMPLRTEQLASFADVCCAKNSNVMTAQ